MESHINSVSHTHCQYRNNSMLGNSSNPILFFTFRYMHGVYYEGDTVCRPRSLGNQHGLLVLHLVLIRYKYYVNY